MYLPPAFAVDDDAEILSALTTRAFGHLVTSGSEPGAGSGSALELAATALPFVVDDELTAIRAHFARANRHWRHIDGSEALLIVPGADAYISPRWYPSKAQDGKVVPTWNYEVVHVHGTIEVHDEVEWKRSVVQDLTTQHEGQVSAIDAALAWQVSDAPSDYIDRMLKAIVGVQLNITKIEAKRKLSQNRSDADRLGVIEGLSASSRRADLDAAARMA